MPARLSAVKPLRSTAISMPCSRINSATWRSLMPRTSTKRSSPAFSAAAHGALVVWSKGQADDLEARAVVALEQLGHEMGRRMAVEVGRQIGKPNALVPRSGGDQRCGGEGILEGDEGSGAAKLRPGRQRVAEEREGRIGTLAALDGRNDGGGRCLVVRPVAEVAGGYRAACRPRTAMVRRHGHQAGERLALPHRSA